MGAGAGFVGSSMYCWEDLGHLPFPLQVISITLKEYELSNMETLSNHRPGKVISATQFSHNDFLHLVIDEFTQEKSISNLENHYAHEFATLSTGTPSMGREDPASSHTVHRETSVMHSFGGRTAQFNKFTVHILDKDGHTPRMHRAHFWFQVEHVEGLRGYC